MLVDIFPYAINFSEKQSASQTESYPIKYIRPSIMYVYSGKFIGL